MTFGSFIDKYFKAIVFALILIIAGSILSIVLVSMSNTQAADAYISIMVAPTTAKVTLNDKEYKTGSYTIEPGEYNVRIEADGFETKEFKIKAERGRVVPIETYLLNQNFGIEYYESSRDGMDILRRLNNKDADLVDFLERFEKKKRIIYDLPFDASFTDSTNYNNVIGNKITVKIEDGTNDLRCDMVLCLIASGYRIDENKVIEVIRSKGYNPQDYKIIFNYYGENK